MKIWYNNHVMSTTTTITCFSEDPSYPCSTGLTDTRLSRKYRTVNDASEYIIFDLGSTSKSVSDVFILGHNLTSTATVTIAAAASTAFATFSTTATVADDIWHNISTTQTYRYWRLSFVDGANPDTFLEFSHIFLGEALSMPPMDRSQKIPYDTTADVKFSVSGQCYGTKNLIPRSATIQFPYISTTQKANIDTFFAANDIVTPFIMYIWPSAPTAEPLLYCVLTDAPKWQKVAAERLLYSLEFTFKEVF